MNRILVIGAASLVGRPLISQLVSAGVPVRVLSRNPGALALPPEVEIVRGDLTLAESLEPCLQGVDSVFLVWTVPADTAAPVLERIAKHARRIVFLSAPLKTPHPFFQQPNPIRTLAEHLEKLIEASGLEWTYLRPGMFARNAVVWWAQQIRAGDVVRWPYLDAPTAPIDERDIAAVGVRALTQDGHAGAEYVITGPESLTHRQQISTIARALGRTLRIEEMPPDEFRRLGSEHIANMLLNAWAAAMGQPAYVSSTFAEVIGKPPRSFSDWATDHVGEFQA